MGNHTEAGADFRQHAFQIPPVRSLKAVTRHGEQPSLIAKSAVASRGPTAHVHRLIHTRSGNSILEHEMRGLHHQMQRFLRRMGSQAVARRVLSRNTRSYCRRCQKPKNKALRMPRDHVAVRVQGLAITWRA